MCEDADLRIGEDEPADQIVLQIAFDRAAKRLFGQTAPGFARNRIYIKPTTEFVSRHEWFQHCVPDVLGKNARQMIKLFHLFVLGLASSKIDNRLPTDLLIDIA